MRFAQTVFCTLVVELWAQRWVMLNYNGSGSGEGKVRPGQTGMCVCVVRSQYSSMELDCDKNAPKPRFTARVKQWLDGWMRKCYCIFKMTQFFAFSHFWGLCLLLLHLSFITTQSCSPLWLPESPLLCDRAFPVTEFPFYPVHLHVWCTMIHSLQIKRCLKVIVMLLPNK